MRLAHLLTSYGMPKAYAVEMARLTDTKANHQASDGYRESLAAGYARVGRALRAMRTVGTALSNLGA